MQGRTITRYKCPVCRRPVLRNVNGWHGLYQCTDLTCYLNKSKPLGEVTRFYWVEKINEWRDAIHFVQIYAVSGLPLKHVKRRIRQRIPGAYIPEEVLPWMYVGRRLRVPRRDRQPERGSRVGEMLGVIGRPMGWFGRWKAGATLYER
jgi:hypothetical protein